MKRLLRLKDGKGSSSMEEIREHSGDFGHSSAQEDAKPEEWKWGHVGWKIQPEIHPEAETYPPRSTNMMYEFDERNDDPYAKPAGDVVTVIPTGNDIQLEAFKCLPEFAGVLGTYRNWRNQVQRAMAPIEKFIGHPKYGAALGIIRAKIVGPASNTLINSNASYNFNSFIDILDKAYQDLRPLYVVERDMTSLTQGGKTLREFYDAINRALNILITKIIQSYDAEAAIMARKREAQQTAVRTFIVGLRSEYIKQILYGRVSNTLDEALAIAQTAQYDINYMQLEKRNGSTQRHQPDRKDTYQHRSNQQNYNIRSTNPRYINYGQNRGTRPRYQTNQTSRERPDSSNTRSPASDTGNQANNQHPRSHVNGDARSNNQQQNGHRIHQLQQRPDETTKLSSDFLE